VYPAWLRKHADRLLALNTESETAVESVLNLTKRYAKSYPPGWRAAEDDYQRRRSARHERTGDTQGFIDGLAD
jgi:hypothetical protein